jgi:DNA-binding transcriptional MocR family regulator
MPNNHYPTGVTYSREAMRAIVASARAHRVPILESDDYGELGYLPYACPSLKTFDSTGDVVIQCSNISNILGPDFGIGWVITRKYHSRIVEQNFFANLGSGDGILQDAVALYVSRRSFDHQLRNMRQAMANRMRRGLDLIQEFFPKGSAVSRPNGGYMCWIRGPKDFDSIAVAKIALAPASASLRGRCFLLAIHSAISSD